VRFNNIPALSFGLLSLISKYAYFIWQYEGLRVEVVLPGEAVFHFREVLQHEIFASNFEAFGEVIDFLIGPHCLVDG
jgi:hypothetical protein